MISDYILIYGSFAKKETTPSSDIDILVVSDKEKSEIIIDQYLSDINTSNKKIDLKIMTHRHFNKLVEINSLYVHHLIQSAIILLGEKSFRQATSGIKKYTIVNSQINNLIQIAEDCLVSIEDNGANIFDLSILFTFLRNCIILINYYKGVLEFNKLKLIDVFESLEFENINIRETYMICYDAKNKYNRNIYVRDISNRWTLKNKKEVKRLINIFKEEMEDEKQEII